MMEITSTEAQNNFGRYLKLAWFEDVVITKNGKQAVVIKRYEEAGSKASIVVEKAEPYIWDKEKITYEDFLKLSEASENRYEFIDGEVYLLASPSYDHQRIIVEIITVMHSYFKGSSCRPLTSPFDVTLTNDDNKNVVQPDILVICDTENISEKGRYTGIPTLVVEVLSESTQKKDMLKKLNLYLHAGVKEYWIVNPARREVYVYCFDQGDIKQYLVFQGSQSVNSLIFEGLAVPLEQLFS
jgi:prevent-host-death family protein